MKINIVFDDGPGPQTGRFVEVEDLQGHSIGVGEWLRYPRRSDPALRDWWVLQLEVPDDTVRR